MLQLILLINYFGKIFFCLVFVGLLKVTVELYNRMFIEWQDVSKSLINDC